MTANILNKTVITGGYCIGCGACAAVADSPIEMSIDSNGCYQAVVDLTQLSSELPVAHVCPFSDSAESEDTVASAMYSKTCKYDSNIGYYQDIYAGHVRENRFRESGSSGGFGTWMGFELLQQGMVDYVVSVAENENEGGPLFKYKISSDIEEICRSSKSRYYPVELSEALGAIRQQPGRYAIVGLPCFIKAVRLLQKSDTVFAERISYCIGLVCGHLKSRLFAENLAWQCGIEPGTLKEIDFRKKIRGEPANRYGIRVSDGVREVVVGMRDLIGGDWGAGAFKYKACDFCDDVFAETADVTVGDAWLPKYVHDDKGTSILVVRSGELLKLIEAAQAEGRLELDELSVRDAVRSQAGGVRHRKDAISYRLQREKRKGQWIPKKRRRPSVFIFSRHEREIQERRECIRQFSFAGHHLAIRTGDLKGFEKGFLTRLSAYKGTTANLMERIVSRVRRRIRRIP